MNKKNVVFKLYIDGTLVKQEVRGFTENTDDYDIDNEITEWVEKSMLYTWDALEMN